MLSLQYQHFIEKYIHLIDADEWEQFYYQAAHSGFSITDTHKLTLALNSAGIYPLDNSTCLPEEYLAGCSSLSTFTIPPHITKIGNLAFYKTGLTSIIIPEGVLLIGDNAFCECSDLVEVHFPSTLGYIGSCAFRNCPNLKKIYYNGTSDEWHKIDKMITSFASSVNDYKAVKCLDGYVKLRTS